MSHLDTIARTLALMSGLALAVGCDDAPPPTAPPPGTGGAARPAGGPSGVPGPAPKKKKKKEEPEVELTAKDFKEGPANRDPFRSFLSEFKPVAKRVTKFQGKVILRRYGLDELQLIAVVSGKAVRPRAMFRDPGGLGVTVRRGQRISKNAARVKRILKDKVVVEIEEEAEDRSTKVDRIIRLHPKDRQGPEDESEQAAGAAEGGESK